MIKPFAIISTLLLCSVLSAQPLSDTIFTQVDLMPYFNGCRQIEKGTPEKRSCSDEEIVKYISRHLIYPAEAMEANTEGTVYVSFVIDRSGKVRDYSILKDIGNGCGEAALKVVAQMPAWEPGVQEGQEVNVRLNLPIQFYLKTPEKVADLYSLTWGILRGDATSVSALRSSIGQDIFVRGPEGDLQYIDELIFTFEKKKRRLTASSRGEISEELRRIVRKAKRGGVFTISASVQDKGRFISVKRSFQIVK